MQSDDERIGQTDVEEEEEGEDLIEGLNADYEEIPHLDTLEDTNLDNEAYEPMDLEQRKAAELAIDERSRKQGRGRSRFFPAALEDDEDLPFSLEQRRALATAQTGETEEEGIVNLDDYQGPVREYLDQEPVRREVKSRFRKFLTTFRDTGAHAPKYPERITKMCLENKCSLEVSYPDLAKVQPTLAVWLADFPKDMLELFDEVAIQVVKYEFPKYESIQSYVNVRISNLPLTDNLRELREVHLNAFVQVAGVVTRRTNVFPQLRLVKFDCIKCGFVLGPFAQQANKEIRPPSCPDCTSTGPFRLNEAETLYRNYQKIVLQESPGSVPAGRIPRSRDVILVDDLCDDVRPGELIKVTGTYKNVFEPSVNIQHGFPVFSTIIEANHIVKEKDYYSQYVITDDDKTEILKLSKRSDIESIIVSSIAPSIYGYDYIKRAIAYSLFGGSQKKNSKTNHSIRADINILILGDPGVAKSQFLRYTEGVAHRAVYATGKGASAVGLTASVRRDPITREWTLEGGALVLADRGVCLIDEFDKMNEQDRTSIHEAMEQQSISISKAGIVATLQARCAVIAAANPIKGRYDGSVSFVENVDLTDPILSRFDVLAVVRDHVDATRDEMLADFVVGNHIASHPNAPKHDKQDQDQEQEQEQELQQNQEPKSSVDNGQISQTMLRKYIFFAKSNISPKLENIDREKIANFYSELREKSMEGGGIPIAVRHIESMLRLAEARAKLHLREYVRNDDVDMAISVMLESFIDTQKQSVQNSLRYHFKRYLTHQKDSISLLLHVLEQEVNEEMTHRRASNSTKPLSQPVEIEIAILEDKAESLQITDLTTFFQSARFRDEGFQVDRKKGLIIKNLR